MNLALQPILSPKFFITGFYIPSENVIVTGYDLAPHASILEKTSSSSSPSFITEKQAFDMLEKGRPVRSVLLSSDVISYTKSLFPTLNNIQVITNQESTSSTDGGAVKNYIDAADTVDMLLEYFRFYVMNISRDEFLRLESLNPRESRVINKDFIELVLDRAERECRLSPQGFMKVVKDAYQTPYFDSNLDIYGTVDSPETLKACIDNTRVFIYNIFRVYKKSLTENLQSFYTQGSKIPNYVFQISETELIHKTNSQVFDDFLREYSRSDVDNGGSHSSIVTFKTGGKILVCQEAESTKTLEEAAQINLTYKYTKKNILSRPNILFRDIDPRVIWSEDDMYDYEVMIDILDKSGQLIQSERRVITLKVEIPEDGRFELRSSVIIDQERIFGYLYSVR